MNYKKLWCGQSADLGRYFVYFMLLFQFLGCPYVCFGRDNASPVKQTVDLRGYGKVTAEIYPDRSSFICQDENHADILLGKLLADLFWDVPEEKRTAQEVKVGSKKILVYTIPDHGALVVGRLANRVEAIGGTDKMEVATMGGKSAVLGAPECVFQPQKPYPYYLDYLDLRAVKCYAHCMISSPRKEGVLSHWPFLKQFGFGGTSFNLGGGMLSASPAPGISYNYAGIDFEVHEAGYNQSMIVPSFSVGGEMPLWAANMFPESVVRLSPNALDTALIRMSSSGMSQEKLNLFGLDGMREVILRYKDNPAIGGWQFYDGPDGIEVGAHFEPSSDFSPDGLADFQRFLKEDKGLDLKTAGERYRGNPNAFQNWSDIKPQGYVGFFGNLDESCFVLRDWQWQLVGEKSQPPVANNPDWKKVTFPSTDEMNQVPNADVFYRIQFNADDWVKKNAGQDIYLITGGIMWRQPNKTKVWLNGQYLGERNVQTTGRYMESDSIQINNHLRSGTNELVLMVPHGRMESPYFLTTHKAEYYPSSNPHLNAYHADTQEWLWTRNIQRHDKMFTLARSLDPDREFTMATGSAWEAAGGCAEIAEKLGVTLQNTGREAFYQPWWARLARAYGNFYSSSEPSATTKADITQPNSLNRLLGWVLIDGDSALILYWNVEDYIQIERETGWFTKNKRLLELVGKSIPEAPELLVLRSSLNLRLYHNLDSECWYWDLGRGELNSLHYNWGYTDESKLVQGFPPQAKILFDSGSTIMEAKTVDAIEKFVADGGTFVALHNTGRHDPIYANSWPISRLTGCKVLEGNGSGKIKFDEKQTLFKEWAGKEFEEEGDAGSVRKEVAIHLKPLGSDVQTLARWSDGSAAVTSRQIGKGYVICLGSTFWRVGKYPERLKILLSRIGAKNSSDASMKHIWLSDATTKNGLEDWHIAFNTKREQVTSDLKFKVETQPTEVREIVSGTNVPFSYADGWVHLKDVEFENTQTKVFAVNRATMAKSISFWWDEKIHHWGKSSVQAFPKEKISLEKLGVLRLGKWKFFADRDGKISSDQQWLGADFDDSSWSKINAGPWNYQLDDLRDYNGTGLYRVSFDLPQGWEKSAINLCIFSSLTPPVFGDVEFIVNGKSLPVPTMPKEPPYTVDISKQLIPGRNQLAVKFKGGTQHAKALFGGLAGVVYLEKQKLLNPSTALNNWRLVEQNGNSSALTLPANSASGRYLTTDFAVPPDWKSGPLYLRIETNSDWVKMVAVNGKYCMSPRFRSFGRAFELNISSYAEPGKTVQIELWGNTFIGGDGWASRDVEHAPVAAAMNLKWSQIGCELSGTSNLK